MESSVRLIERAEEAASAKVGLDARDKAIEYLRSKEQRAKSHNLGAALAVWQSTFASALCAEAQQVCGKAEQRGFERGIRAVLYRLAAFVVATASRQDYHEEGQGAHPTS